MTLNTELRAVVEAMGDSNYPPGSIENPINDGGVIITPTGHGYEAQPAPGYTQVEGPYQDAAGDWHLAGVPIGFGDGGEGGGGGGGGGGDGGGDGGDGGGGGSGRPNVK